MSEKDIIDEHIGRLRGNILRVVEDIYDGSPDSLSDIKYLVSKNIYRIMGDLRDELNEGDFTLNRGEE